jgi:hypothetical protein
MSMKQFEQLAGQVFSRRVRNAYPTALALAGRACTPAIGNLLKYFMRIPKLKKNHDYSA